MTEERALSNKPRESVIGAPVQCLHESAVLCTPRKAMLETRSTRFNEVKRVMWKKTRVERKIRVPRNNDA